MVEHGLKCIFIHQRKAAGSAIIMSFGLEPGQADWNAFNDGVLSKGWSAVQDHLRDYYIFSAIRNPFDRLVSAWKYLPSERRRRLIDVLRDPPLAGEAFRHLTRPQSALLVDPATGHLVTHDLIRFETLQQDYDRVCDRIGKPRSRLKKVNRSWRWKSYRSYFDDETRKLAEALFREDLDRFGYEF